MISLLMVSAICCLPTLAQDLVPKHDLSGHFGYTSVGSDGFAITPQWDEARQFNEAGVAVVRTGDKYGFINKQGTAIGTELGYSMIAQYDGTDCYLVAVSTEKPKSSGKGMAMMGKGLKFMGDMAMMAQGASPASGTPPPPSIRERLFLNGFKGSMSYAMPDVKWGIANSQGILIVPAIYDEVSNLMNGNMVALVHQGGIKLRSLQGDVVFPTSFSEVTPFNNLGIAAVKSGSNWLLINKEGETIVPATAGCKAFYCFKDDPYAMMNDLPNDSILLNPMAQREMRYLMPVIHRCKVSWIDTDYPYVVGVKGTGKCVLYDLNGKELISVAAGLDRVCAPSEGVAVAYKGDMWGFYDMQSMAFTVCKGGRRYTPVKEGVSLTRKTFGYGNNYFVNTQGEKVTDPYENVVAAGNCYIVNNGNFYGLLSQDGKVIIEASMPKVINANGGLYGVLNKENKFGYVNAAGETVIPFDYEQGDVFVDNYAVVRKGNKSGVINANNEVVIPLNYDRVAINVDSDKQLHVWVSNGETFSKLEGDTLMPTQYTQLEYMPIGLTTQDANNLYGLIHQGAEIIPCSLKQASLIPMVLYFMLTNQMDQITAAEARRIAITQSLKEKRLNLTDTIEESLWDF